MVHYWWLKVCHHINNIKWILSEFFKFRSQVFFQHCSNRFREKCLSNLVSNIEGKVPISVKVLFNISVSFTTIPIALVFQKWSIKVTTASHKTISIKPIKLEFCGLSLDSLLYHLLKDKKNGAPKKIVKMKLLQREVYI